MNLVKRWLIPGVMTLAVLSCKKEGNSGSGGSSPFTYVKATINDSLYQGGTFANTPSQPVVKIIFSQPIKQSTVSGSVYFSSPSGAVPFTYSFPNDSSLSIQTSTALQPLTTYIISVFPTLKSVKDSALTSNVRIVMITAIDSSDKFPQISDSALLTLVERQTFNYFWAYGHPVAGMARERASSNDIVTTGGSGFGVMAMLVAVERSFITRAQALARIDTIVNFLTYKVTHYHGAFPHWIQGSTGATIPFSPQDDGGDIVETSDMLQGLLCARQYFNSTTDSGEINLRAAINNLWHGVDWNWYRNGGQYVLYWNWSPNYNFAINVQVNGWDEALITYVLAASATGDSIPKPVYDIGWAQGGAMRNGKAFYGITLPLGPDYGGPLFFAHYSFLGINPNGLSDAYANYWTQDTAHARINFLYCVNNPGNYYGYSASCWGLTASDVQGGYNANSPTSDMGVIAPTAAISSLPYTPKESMDAIRFFYYKLGNKLWGPYGFYDAFNLNNPWFDSDCLAIDQGPEIVMIENYRTGLLWNLFMSCPEIKAGMTRLGFQSPNL